MKVKLVLYYLVLIGLVLQSCKGSKNSMATSSAKENLENIKSVINSKAFRFKANFAYPIQSSDVIQVTNVLLQGTENMGGQISLSANDDYLKIKRDSTQGNLSYFGEMRNVGYNDIADNSIIFSDLYREFEVKEDKKRNKLVITFVVNNSVEQFRINLVVFKNLTSNLVIYGSNRTAIRYRGEIIPLDP